MPNPYISIVGPILAATIAGFVTFLITVLTKEQKISEFRQAWIDALRNDIADFIGLMSVTVSVVRIKVRTKVPEEEILKYLLDKEIDFAKLEALANKIRLRANPKEHVAFLSALENFERLPQNMEKLVDHKVSEDLEKTFLKESQFLLKTEWQRVKRGEPMFRFAKWSSLGGVVIALAGGGTYVLCKLGA